MNPRAGAAAAETLPLSPIVNLTAALGQQLRERRLAWPTSPEAAELAEAERAVEALLRAKLPAGSTWQRVGSMGAGIASRCSDVDTVVWPDPEACEATATADPLQVCLAGGPTAVRRLEAAATADVL